MKIMLIKSKWFISSSAFLILLLSPTLTTATLTSNDAHKAIVKIYSYCQGEEYLMTLSRMGSGVIINNKGIVLTNYHVVSSEDEYGNDIPMVFKVCLTNNSAEKPICEYSADIITKDKNKDLALLKIKNIANLSDKINFDYLKRTDKGNFNIGDSVKAFGYPGIGGDTVTITSGTISGVLEKYSQSWIKTDTLFSSGSSGGALINNAGELIGITSRAHSDLIGSLGYVLDVNSINSWINNNINNNLQIVTPYLQEYINSQIKRQNIINNTNIFNHNYMAPNFSVAKNDAWEFEFSEEGGISIINPNNNDGGKVIISYHKNAVLQETKLNQRIEAAELLINISKKEDLIFKGKQCKKLIYSAENEELYQILIPEENYLITITYYYGKNIIDKKIVDQILDSMTFGGGMASFRQLTSYKNKDPYFKITVPIDWGLMRINLIDNPIMGEHKINSLNFSAHLKYLTESIKGMTNQEYFDYFKNNDSAVASYEAIGYKTDLYFESMNYKINNEINNAIFYKYKIKDEDDDNKVIVYIAGYRVILGDYALVVILEYLGEDELLFEQYVNDFNNNILVNLTLKQESGQNNQECVDTDDGNDFYKKGILSYQGDTYIDYCDGNNLMEYSCLAITALELLQQEEKKVMPVRYNCKNGCQDGACIKIISNIKVKNLANNFSKKLIGKIILEVENKGKAWYLNPINNKAYYLGRPADAFSVMREQGTGITNENLAKISVGLNNLTGKDTDGDGLSDIFEDAIGTDKNNADTDGDSYNDKAELNNGYNPNGLGRLGADNSFSNSQKGKIFLQVENRGEAWYVNPNDGKRYFLGRPADAFQVMRNLGLGISNSDFDKL